MRNDLLPADRVDPVKAMQADLRSDSADYALLIGNDCGRRGWWASARSCWRMVLRLTDQRSYAALVGTGVSYREEGDHEQALEYFDLAGQAAQTQRDRAIARFHMGLTAGAQGDSKRARHDLEECVEKFPGCGMGWVALAQVAQLQGDTAGARDAANICLSRDDATPELGDAHTAARTLLATLSA
jgi:tetratricopeptide (TPR) repeat protein